MRISRQDLKRLRIPLAASLLMTALGVGCFVATERTLWQARSGREAAKAQRLQAQQRLDKVAEEEREIRDNLRHYAAMVERGMTGRENRLDLIDAIAHIKAQRRLFDVHYSIDPQKPLDYAGVSPAGPVDFVSSRIQLEMSLLHEEDLVNFLGDLQAAGNTYVSVRNCSLARIERSAAGGALAPRLRSECQVDVIALKGAQP